MAKDILQSLGYCTNEQLKALESAGKQLPPQERWVDSNLRRTVALVADTIASLRTLRKGDAGKKVQGSFGRDALLSGDFKGFKILISGDVPEGGFSSSSAVIVALANAINAYYGLGLKPDELVDIAAQAEFATDDRAGALDHATIQKGREDESILISSKASDNYRTIASYPRGPRYEILFAYSVHRHVESARWSAGMYAEESLSGGRPSSADIHNMTGKAAEIAAILLRRPLGADFFNKEIEEDLVDSGALALENRLRVYQYLRAVPLRIPFDELRQRVYSQKEWYVR